MFHDQGSMSFSQGGIMFTVPLSQGDNNYPAKRAGFVNRAHERAALANAMQYAHDNSSASITLTNNSSMDVQVQQGLNKIVLAMNSSTVIDTKWELVVHIGQKHAFLRNHHGNADLMNDSTDGMVKQTGYNRFEIVNSNNPAPIIPAPVPTPPTPTQATVTTTMRLNPGQPIARVGAAPAPTAPAPAVTPAPAVAPAPAPAPDGTRTIIVPPATTSSTVTPPTRAVPPGGIPQTRMVPPRRNPPPGGIPQTRMVPPRTNPPTDSTMAGSLLNATTRQATQPQPPQPATTSVNAGTAVNMANHPGNDPNIVATRLMPGGAWAILSNVGNGHAYGQLNTENGEYRRWIRPSPPSPSS